MTMTNKEAISRIKEHMIIHKMNEPHAILITEALNMAIKALEQESKVDKALNLLAEWVIECGFGYDNIPEEYEKYKDDIAEMGYREGLVYIVKMESEVQK